MRYLVQFADKTTKHLTEDEGKIALAAFAAGRPVGFRGAIFANHLISAIKPVSREWFGRDYVEIDQRVEAAQISSGERIMIEDKKFLGFQDAQDMEKTKGTWSKAGAIQKKNAQV